MSQHIFYSRTLKKWKVLERNRFYCLKFHAEQSSTEYCFRWSWPIYCAIPHHHMQTYEYKYTYMCVPTVLYMRPIHTIMSHVTRMMFHWMHYIDLYTTYCITSYTILRYIFSSGCCLHIISYICNVYNDIHFRI